MPDNEVVRVSTAANKATARRLVEELWNSRGDLSVIEELVEPDMLADGTDRHTMSVREIMLRSRLFRAALPDWRTSIDVLVAEGEQVMLRLTAHGIHTGIIQGIAAAEAIAGLPIGKRDYHRLLLVPPTGRPVTGEVVAHLVFHDGKVASVWILLDEVELMRQFGVLPVIGR